MREATVELETALAYCQSILNAENEEEIAEIKQGIAEDMRTNGTPEEAIENYITGLETIVEKVEEGEYAFTEQGTLAKVDEPSQANGMANSMAGVSLGVITAAIVASIALKKKVLKNHKGKSL